VPTVLLGNESVTEPYKPDEGTDETKIRQRKDLGRRVTSMNLNEVDGDDNPSRAMNLTMVTRLWDAAFRQAARMGRRRRRPPERPDR
jgi:hypothetical protein